MLVSLPEETRAVIFSFLGVRDAISLWVTCQGIPSRGWEISAENGEYYHAKLACQCRAKCAKEIIRPVVQSDGIALSLESRLRVENATLRKSFKGIAEHKYTTRKIRRRPHCVTLHTEGDFLCLLTENTAIRDYPNCRGTIVNLREPDVTYDVVIINREVTLTVQDNLALLIEVRSGYVVSTLLGSTIAGEVSALSGLPAALGRGLQRAKWLRGMAEEAQSISPRAVALASRPDIRGDPLVSPPLILDPKTKTCCEAKSKRRNAAEQLRNSQPLILEAAISSNGESRPLQMRRFDERSYIGKTSGGEHVLRYCSDNAEIRFMTYSVYEITGGTPRLICIANSEASLVAVTGLVAYDPTPRVLTITHRNKRSESGSVCNLSALRISHYKRPHILQNVTIGSHHECKPYEEIAAKINSCLEHQFDILELSQRLTEIPDM